ncbi:MAG TPA: hypothetical protein VK911_05750 [Vicinamibacterales bacterium]|nr:hypothetical protein [Vicinamibacterales bacterium]
MRHAGVVALVAILAGAAFAAVRPQEPFNDAVSIGLSSDQAARTRFHAPYIERLGGPVIQALEVVTEFRRMVLLAEAHARAGEAGWDAARAAAALAPYRGRVDVILHLQFSPQNTYRTVPPVSVVLYTRGGGPPLRPGHVEVTPANVAGPIPPGTPILSARVEAHFPADALDARGTHLVGVSIDGRETQRIPIDLSRLR